jgi:exonuclease VII small subunit
LTKRRNYKYRYEEKIKEIDEFVEKMEYYGFAITIEENETE